MPTLRHAGWLALLGVLGSGGAAGCAEREKELQNLDGRMFLSESVRGKTLVPKTRIRINFDDAGIHVSAGCNQLFGDYRIEDGVLIVDGLGSTAIGCDAERVAQDTWLSDLLTGRPEIELDGPRLRLSQDVLELVLLDVEMASPDLPLVGTPWQGNGFGDGQAIGFGPGAELVSVQFDEDGEVTIFTACRNGTGRFSADDTMIEFEQLKYDDTPCSAVVKSD